MVVDFGGSEAGKRGGKARAEKLSKEERSAIARRGAIAKWEKEGKVLLPMATHGSDDHPLVIGDIEIPCYVLEDSTRVITNRGLQRSLGMAVSGGAQRMVGFLQNLSAKGLECKDLIARINQPIEFQPTRGGRSAFGYEATVLADLCDVLLAARKKKALTPIQERFAESAEILVRGFARVGIIALVDEATGYQEVRDRFALQEILDTYLRKEFAAWAKRFPDEFYQEIFRLRGWVWKGMRVNRPSCVAAYTRNLVYERLAPGILHELELRNPMADKGYRLHKHHQLLTEDVGHPALAQHLHALLGLMRASDTWQQMMKMVNRAFPKRGDSLQMDLFKNDGNGDDDE
jgi:P63C domain